MEAADIIALEYTCPRLLPSGEWAALYDFMFTCGLIVGIEEFSYRTRFCYPNRDEALKALETWDGYCDPPGPWIKEKGRNERNNPALATFGGATIVTEARGG